MSNKKCRIYAVCGVSQTPNSDRKRKELYTVMELLEEKEGLETYKTYLIEMEKGRATIEKYLRDIRAFSSWLGENREVTKERVMEYKS